MCDQVLRIVDLSGKHRFKLHPYWQHTATAGNSSQT